MPQLELGTDSRVDAADFDDQQSIPVTIRYAVLNSMVVEADIEPFLSQAATGGGLRSTGVGDTVVGAQWVIANEARRQPTISAAYYVKLPTAPHAEDLGTGRIDHRIVLLLSRRFGETDSDLNIAYLNVGSAERDRRASGRMIGASISREFRSRFGYVAERSHSTQDVDLPHGAYTVGALTYRVSERLRLDGGTRIGLTHDEPRFGIVAGFSLSAPIAIR